MSDKEGADRRRHPGRLALLSVFLACALIVGIIEHSIPFEFIVPGVKLGLANVVVLTAIYLFRFRETLALVVLKCVTISFFTGSFVTFVYSLSGSLLSLVAMYLLTRLGEGRISPVGVSVVGAVCHNLGQIAAASVLMRTWMIVSYLPVLLVSGVITGVLVGLAVKYTLGTVRGRLADRLISRPSDPPK